MDDKDIVFRNLRPIPCKLLNYGFVESCQKYSYSVKLEGSGFVLEAEVYNDGNVLTRVVDPETDERYGLHLSDGACGSFVGMVKDEYRRVLEDIAKNCFEPDVFASEQAKLIIRIAYEKYGSREEYLWETSPDAAVLRRLDNKKWFAVLMKIPRKKLGYASDEIVEVIDLRIDPDELDKLLPNGRYFRGWHMNKRLWTTIILDGSVDTTELIGRLESSYFRAGRK